MSASFNLSQMALHMRAAPARSSPQHGVAANLTQCSTGKTDMNQAALVIVRSPSSFSAAWSQTHCPTRLRSSIFFNKTDQV